MALKDYYNTGDDSSVTVGTSSYLVAQTFTTSSAYDLNSVKLKLWRHVSNAPGTLTIDIKATDGSSHPTGASLRSGTTDGDTLTTDSGGEWREITLASVLSLTNATKYAIIITQSTGTAGAFGWRADGSSPSYAGGAYERAGNPTWFTNTGVDLMFETHTSGTISELSGTVAAQSVVSGNMVSSTASELSGMIAAVSVVTGNIMLSSTSELSGTITAVSTVGPASLGSVTVDISVEMAFIKRLVVAGNNQIWYEAI